MITHNYPSKKNLVEGVFLHRIYRELEDQIEIEVILLKPFFGLPKIGSHYTLENIKIHEVKYFRPRGRLFNSLDGIFALSAWSVIKKLVNGQKIIHAHWQTISGPVGLLISLKYKIPLIVSVRGARIFSKAQYSIYGFVSRHIFNCSQKIHTHGKNIADTIKSKYNISSDKILFIPNIIFNNTNVSLKSTVNITNGIDKNDIVVLFVGLDSKLKGLKDAVLAFANVNSKEKLKFVILSDFNTTYFKEQIQPMVTHENNIILLEPVNPDQMHKIYEQCDVFLYTSYHDGVPNVVIEAMAKGCYIICYNIPGVKELIHHGVNGRKVETGNIKGLQDELSRYLRIRNSTEILQYEKYNQNLYENLYNQDSIRSAYLNLYSSLIAEYK